MGKKVDYHKFIMVGVLYTLINLAFELLGIYVDLWRYPHGFYHLYPLVLLLGIGLSYFFHKIQSKGILLTLLIMILIGFTACKLMTYFRSIGWLEYGANWSFISSFFLQLVMISPIPLLNYILIPEPTDQIIGTSIFVERRGEA